MKCCRRAIFAPDYSSPFSNLPFLFHSSPEQILPRGILSVFPSLRSMSQSYAALLLQEHSKQQGGEEEKVCLGLMIFCSKSTIGSFKTKIYIQMLTVCQKANYLIIQWTWSVPQAVARGLAALPSKGSEMNSPAKPAQTWPRCF